MVYNKEDLLSILSSSFGLLKVPDEFYKTLRSSDVKRSPGLSNYCPTCCTKNRVVLYRVGTSWKCCSCLGAKIVKNPKDQRNIHIHMMLNDVLDYAGGSLNSDQIFNPDFVDGFVNFSGIKDDPKMYVIFMTFVKAVLAKEVGKLAILSYIEKGESKLKRQSEFKPVVSEGKSELKSTDTVDKKPELV